MYISAAVSALILLPTFGLASTSTFNATYDDLKTIPDEGLLTPVGNYLGLSYQNFDVAQLSLLLNESTSGVIPHSGSNAALAGAGTRTITTQSKSFTPMSVYYGCAAESGQGAVSAAAPCNITVKGYKAGSSSSPSATQTLKFVPLELVDVMNPLTFASSFVSAFKDVKMLTFSVQPAVGVTFVLDDFYYITKS